MNISPLHLNNSILNLKFKGTSPEEYKTVNPEIITTQASSLDALASYNKAGLPKEIDFDSFDNKSIDEEFTHEEIYKQFENGGINLTAICNCAYSSFAKELAAAAKENEIEDKIPEYLKIYREEIEENNGNIPWYKVNEELSDNLDSMLKDLAQASFFIRRTGQKENEHILYRMLMTDYNGKLSSLKPGEQTILSNSPMYVGFSAKDLGKKYGSDIILEMIMPKGSYIAAFEMPGGLEEGFVDACAKFEVIDNKEYKDGKRVITLKHILPEE